MEAYPVVRLLSTGVLLFALTCSVHGQIRSLYGDVRAYRVGDVITVILLESAQAQRESRWANASEASSEGGAVLQGGVLPGSPSIGLNTSAKNAASNQNQSVQRDLLRATLSARVVGTDEGGNLLIEGQRTVEINGAPSMCGPTIRCCPPRSPMRRSHIVAMGCCIGLRVRGSGRVCWPRR
jgi:hypothetical protein